MCGVCVCVPCDRKLDGNVFKVNVDDDVNTGT